MIEEKISSYLRCMLDIEVGMQQPDEETGKYIIIEKTGSSTQNFITTASIVIKSYADSKYVVPVN